jgi:hypothetical protein
MELEVMEESEFNTTTSPQTPLPVPSKTLLLHHQVED